MDLDDSSWLQWPDKCCVAQYLKRDYGDESACGKPAIAVAVYRGEEVEPHSYPVCMHHARGRPMLPLREVIAMARK